jgi:hypothetical protein
LPVLIRFLRKNRQRLFLRIRLRAGPRLVPRPGGKVVRESLTSALSFASVYEILESFVEELRKQNIHYRTLFAPEQDANRFFWNPNREMDREADAAVFETPELESETSLTR